jgi:uncharacterized membrane protein
MTVDASSFAPGPSRAFRWPRAKYLLAALIAVMYAYALWTNESFLFNPRDPEWRHIAPFKMILLPHGMSAAFALFLGPLQFSDRLRRKYLTLHRITGYLYIAGCYIGAPIGIYIQYFEERMGEARSFTIAVAADAVLWIFATTMALIFVRQGKVQQHRQWMTRSFACALIFLEVRAIAVLFQIPPQLSETVVWCCVAAAFPLADLVLQIEEQLRLRARPARSPVRITP